MMVDPERVNRTASENHSFANSNSKVMKCSNLAASTLLETLSTLLYHL